ncbi:DUF4167 domain-containing protein [Paracoccus endophyticus]|uniref:DUF4167 domain-containing protein n=1 Tax=Paracoccus endophyticus TaxID=2233774 RepID=UPI000DDA1ADD|nr:DUF4167 domain-containing protein [Paracoccus endophyticus]
MRSSKSRSRNKSRNPRSLGNVVNRVFDSSGPEGKVRGTPQQIIEKYLALARDAQLSNDRVAEQSFLQHAEHYTRMLGEAQREQADRQGSFGGYADGERDDRPVPNGNGNGNGYHAPPSQGGPQNAERRDDRRDDNRSDRRDDNRGERRDDNRGEAREGRSEGRTDNRERRDDRQDRNPPRQREDRRDERSEDRSPDRGDGRRERDDRRAEAPARPPEQPASLSGDQAPQFLLRPAQDRSPERGAPERGIPEAIDPQDGPVETPEDRAADAPQHDAPAPVTPPAAVAAEPAEAPARPRRTPRKPAEGEAAAPPRAPRTRKRADPEAEAPAPVPTAD